MKNEEYAVKLTITLPPSVVKRLKEYCEQTGLTKSGVIANALIRYLNQQEQKQSLSVFAVEQLLNNPAFLEKIQTFLVDHS